MRSPSRGAVSSEVGDAPLGGQDAPRAAGLAFVPLGLRGDGAPSGATFFSFAAPLLRGTRAPLGAPSWRFLLPGSAFPGTRQVGQSRVQQAPCGGVLVPPRSGPGASRVRGYEPRPRAPPLLPFPQASCRNAPRWRRWEEYKPIREKCQPIK